MNNKNNSTSLSVPCRFDSAAESSAVVPCALAPRSLAVALRCVLGAPGWRVLGGGLLVAGLVGPALGQSLDPALSPAPSQGQSLELSDLDGSNGFTLNGTSAYDQSAEDFISGWPVSGVGDVNGDGIDDLLIGAPRLYHNTGKSIQSYVVFGSNGGFPAALDLSTLDGSNGFVLNGIEPKSLGLGDQSGRLVSGAGDVNGDGIGDFLIGAPGANSNGDNSGQSYIVFGSSGGFPAVLELSALDGSNGFALNGSAAGDRSGRSVGGAGDVNGDGVDDLLIGAIFSDSDGINIFTDNGNQSYVVFGSSGGFPAVLELSALDGSNGFMLNGIAEGDFSGASVSGAGDVNGDGVDDLLIGALLGLSSAGQSYVVFGSSGGFPAVLELSALDGSNGFALNGIAADDYSGTSVSGAGDVNGDGVDDIIIGAPGADPNGLGKVVGQSYVVFGTATGGGPAALLKALIADIKALDLPKRLGHRLVTKLERAQKKLAQDYVAEAFYKVLRFTQQVLVQRGWRIPEAEADVLIAQAKPVLDEILKVWYDSFKPTANHAHDPSPPQ